MSLGSCCLAGILPLSQVPGKCQLELPQFLGNASNVQGGLWQRHPPKLVLLFSLTTKAWLLHETRTRQPVSQLGSSWEQLPPTASEGTGPLLSLQLARLGRVVSWRAD